MNLFESNPFLDQMDQALDLSFMTKYDKLVVELGCGDGNLLSRLSDKNEEGDTFYLGIEIEPSEFNKSRLLISNSRGNLLFVNSPFEHIIDELPNFSADEILSILPHPKYIDREFEIFWRPLYRNILQKIKKNGHMLLITEYTDELFSPVIYDEYVKWKEWIIGTFTDLGFCVSKKIEQAPPDYSSKYLDLFSNDQERIKILSLYLTRN